MMERRTHPREHRRLQVVFWDRDDPDDRRTGFTTNTSAQGAFVTTHRPLRSGTRVQMELDRGPGTFLIEGVVMRSVTMPPDLRKLKPGGMGIRFLGFDAYLEELHLQEEPSERAEEPSAASTDPEPAGGASGPPADRPAAGDAPAPSARQRHVRLEREPAGSGSARLHPAASPILRSPAHAGEPARDEELPRFRLEFATLEALRDAFDRDLQLGGLFVPTERPAALDARIAVSLDLPQGRGSIEVTARVAQALPPGRAARPGMGILIDDATGLADDLRRILKRA